MGGVRRLLSVANRSGTSYALLCVCVCVCAVSATFLFFCVFHDFLLKIRRLKHRIRQSWNADPSSGVPCYSVCLPTRLADSVTPHPLPPAAPSPCATHLVTANTWTERPFSVWSRQGFYSLPEAVCVSGIFLTLTLFTTYSLLARSLKISQREMPGVFSGPFGTWAMPQEYGHLIPRPSF